VEEHHGSTKRKAAFPPPRESSQMTNTFQNHNGVVVTNSEFLQAVLAAAPRGSTVWVNAFIGNPNSDQASWSGKAYNPAMHAAEVDGWSRQNTYFSVGAVRPIEGVMHRRKSHFARLLALVADDVDPEDLQGTPSWGIETSPGKRQIGILLDTQDPDCANLELVSRLVTAMADRGYIKADKSGNNAVRYVRLPVGQNQKPRDSGPFSHVVEYWNPSARYTLEDAAAIFGIDLETLRHEQALAPTSSPSTLGEQDERLRILTSNVIRGENLHDSLNMIAASMVASGAKGGAVVNMLRGLMDASLAPKDDRWLARYNDIPRSVSTAQEKFRPTPIQQAIDPSTGEILPPDKPLFVSVHDLLTDIKPVQWLITSYLETDALSMTFGPSGSGKSFVVVSMACSIATGTPWFGNEVKQGAVFYIAGEGHNGLARRFAAWSKATGVPIAKDTPLFKSTRAVMMLNREAADALMAEVERMVAETGQAPKMVIIDTLARNFGDGDENKQQDANAFIERIDEIRRKWNCNVMVVHHSGHDMDRARGSSVFKGAMDQEFWVKGTSGIIEVKVTKMKDAELPDTRKFKIVQIGLGVMDDADVEIFGAYLKIDGNPFEFIVGHRTNGQPITALEVANLMDNGWPGAPAIAAELGCSQRTVSNIMKSMANNGLAIMAANRKSGWQLTEEAQNQLSFDGREIPGLGGENE
jgi:biotin operon repressor